MVRAPMADAKAPRLRVSPAETPFHIALVEPEIPQNTGSIARLCGATSTPLHLIGHLGFRIDEKSVRRAGVDYWHLVTVQQHPDIEHFAQVVAKPKWKLFSAVATKSYLEADFSPGDALVFGKESVGLPDELLRAHPDNVYGIPTSGAVRSLNIATAVGIVIYEALRKTGALAHAVPRLNSSNRRRRRTRRRSSDSTPSPANNSSRRCRSRSRCTRR